MLNRPTYYKEFQFHPCKRMVQEHIVWLDTAIEQFTPRESKHEVLYSLWKTFFEINPNLAKEIGVSPVYKRLTVFMFVKISVSRIFRALLMVVFFSLFLGCANFGGEKGKKVMGLGMSQSTAGKYFNQSMAETSARKFISDQTHLAAFTYQKQFGKTKFNQIQDGSVSGSQIKESIPFGKTGIAIVMEATVDTPPLTGTKCKSIKQNIYSVDDMDRFTMNVRGNLVVRLIKEHYRNKTIVKGKSLIKNLTIKKISAAPRYKAKATVCIGDIEK